MPYCKKKKIKFNQLDVNESGKNAIFEKTKLNVEIEITF